MPTTHVLHILIRTVYRASTVCFLNNTVTLTLKSSPDTASSSAASPQLGLSIILVWTVVLLIPLMYSLPC